MEVTAPLNLTQAEIVKEVGTIREELAILSWTTRLARPAWQTAFGAGAPDPQGDPSAMEKMTPEQLAGLAQSLFVGNRTSVAVSGGIDQTAALEAASKVFASLPRGPELEESSLKPETSSGSAQADDAWGEGRAATVLDCANTDTLATLAAALALAAHIQESTVVYTPSARDGVVILCVEGDAALKELDGLTQTMMNSLSPSGLAMVKNWARTLGSSPSKSAATLSSLRGQRRTLDLATVQKAASLVQVGLVGRKMNLFKEGNGIMVTSR
jgi:hypothetical protein